MRTVKQLCNIRYQRAIIALVHHPDKWFCMQDEWKCGNSFFVFLVFTIPMIDRTQRIVYSFPDLDICNSSDPFC